MKYLESYESSLSCGINEICNFPIAANYAQMYDGEKRFKEDKASVLDDLKLLDFTGHTHCSSCAMYLVSLNHHQTRTWVKILREHGFKKVGKTVVNPNSNNRISLYIKQKVVK